MRLRLDEQLADGNPTPSGSTANDNGRVAPSFGMKSSAFAARIKSEAITVPGTEQEASSIGRTAAAALDLGSARILLADTDILTRRLVDALLEHQGYDIVELADGSMVLPALEAHAIDLIILDANMRNRAGEEVCQLIRQDGRYGDLPILLMSNPGSRDQAPMTPVSVDDHVVKPIEPADLLTRVRGALRMRRALLGMEAAHMVVATLANEVSPRDADSKTHTERLGSYTAALGRRVGLTAADLHAVAYGTLFHDLGKIGIADAILLKPGPLTEEEREIMKRHTEIGARIAAPLVGSERFGPIIRHHHERWDGHGYPDGLRGEEIPMGARIIGVVDAFDAMTQQRPYRQPLSVAQAIEELRKERGQQFDPDLTNTFIRVLEWDGVA